MYANMGRMKRLLTVSLLYLVHVHILKHIRFPEEDLTTLLELLTSLSGDKYCASQVYMYLHRLLFFRGVGPSLETECQRLSTAMNDNRDNRTRMCACVCVCM